MATTIPSKVQTRMTGGLKKFQSIVSSSKVKDINESDTVVIVTDMLSYLFGYDKYTEITSEQAVKKTHETMNGFKRSKANSKKHRR